jgi:hypothetical protein
MSPRGASNDLSLAISAETARGRDCKPIFSNDGVPFD